MRINEWNQRNQNAAKMNGSGGVQGKGNTKKLGDISTKSCKMTASAAACKRVWCRKRL